MNKELEEMIGVYKKARDNKSLIESIKPEFFFRFTDMLLNYIENSIPKEKVQGVLKDLGKEFNKLDEETDKYLKEENRDLTEYYEQRERTAVMQTIGWAIGKIEELQEGK